MGKREGKQRGVDEGGECRREAERERGESKGKRRWTDGEGAEEVIIFLQPALRRNIGTSCVPLSVRRQSGGLAHSHRVRVTQECRHWEQ